jgi:hypothetical protein
VIDVRRELRIGIGIVERGGEENLVEGLRGGLDASRPGEIFRQRLADEVAKGHPAGFGRLGGTPVKVSRQEQLSPVHV